MTPYVLNELQQQQQQQHGRAHGQAQQASTPTPRLVQILSRGGSFWTSQKIEDEAWLVVSDGQHSVQAHLLRPCRQSIWHHVSNPCPVDTHNPYVFLDYGRGSCGLLQDYQLIVQKGGEATDNTTTACTSISTTLTLQVNAYKCMPGMKDLLFGGRGTHNTTNTATPNSMMMIQPIQENVETRHALQTTTSTIATQPQTQQQEEQQTPKVVLGSVEEALNNPDLMEQIFRLASSAADAGVDSPSIPMADLAPETNNTMDMEQQQEQATTQEGQPAADEDSKSSAEEQEESMNIRDMLKTQPDELAPSSKNTQEPEQQQDETEQEQDEDASMLLTQPPCAQPSQQETMLQDDQVEDHGGLSTQPQRIPSPTRTSQQQLLLQPPATPPPPPHDRDTYDATTQTPERKRQREILHNSMMSSNKKNCVRGRQDDDKGGTSYWKLLVQQLSDSTVQMITVAVESPPKLLRQGLSRWLAKNSK
jgi:hypothetical protein